MTDWIMFFSTLGLVIASMYLGVLTLWTAWGLQLRRRGFIKAKFKGKKGRLYFVADGDVPPWEKGGSQ